MQASRNRYISMNRYERLWLIRHSKQDSENTQRKYGRFIQINASKSTKENFSLMMKKSALRDPSEVFFGINDSKKKLKLFAKEDKVYRRKITKSILYVQQSCDEGKGNFRDIRIHVIWKDQQSQSQKYDPDV